MPGPHPLHVAIDLGAGSGRALIGAPGGGGFRLSEVHRFHYAPRQAAGHLRWDVTRLVEGIQTGLKHAWAAAAAEGSPIASVGVDSWGVDYALLDRDGALVEEPVCYRDDRTADAMDRVFAILPREAIYARTGIQFMPFNTLYQLAAHARAGVPERAAHLLLIPDFCHHHLCGSLVSERTDASTTQLLDARSGMWDDGLIERLGLPRRLMPDIVDAGSRLGTLSPRLCADLGITPAAVVAPATHDTASAVAGTPLEAGWAYISSGTWSLVGVERRDPLLSDEAMRAGLTNEIGVGRTIRLLTNVMGLWLLESCRREWETEGRPQALEPLLAAVARIPNAAGVVYPDDRRFFAPASMVGELRTALRESGQEDSDDPVVLTKVILDSLALRYAEVVSAIERLTGEPIPGVHIVGGGSLNAYLNQATADASGRPVLAGPVEATAIGNLLVQGMAAGAVASIVEGRALVARAFPPARCEPGRRSGQTGLAARYADLSAASRGVA
jgi:rhamnulokinase